MPEITPLRIRLVNRLDHCGGAEIVVQDQLRAYRALGHDVQLLVGERRENEPGVIPAPCKDEAWLEAFSDADVIHFHNLHGQYFNPELLYPLSQRTLVVLTLHDQFLFTGGCVHTGDCSRWKTGCGECPQIVLTGELDHTAESWARKRRLWSQCRLHVVAPALWIYERARNSILGRGAATIHHIPNGVDTSLFRAYSRPVPGASKEIILLTAAQRLRTNRSKDWPLLQAAIELLDSMLAAPATLLVMGDRGPDVRYRNLTVRSLGHVSSRAAVAELFSSSDIFIHPTRAETFSLAILEAMASGCAVVATGVGGIAEQLNPKGERPRGIVVPPGDARALATAVANLIREESLRRRLAYEAANYAAAEWALSRHVDAHLALYRAHLMTGRK